MKGQEDIIQGIRKRLEELEVRDKKREMALETANLLLDKELERVSNFVEEKVPWFTTTIEIVFTTYFCTIKSAFSSQESNEDTYLIVFLQLLRTICYKMCCLYFLVALDEARGKRPQKAIRA